jgi:hypothetical protein
VSFFGAIKLQVHTLFQGFATQLQIQWQMSYDRSNDRCRRTVTGASRGTFVISSGRNDIMMGWMVGSPSSARAEILCRNVISWDCYVLGREPRPTVRPLPPAGRSSRVFVIRTLSSARHDRNLMQCTHEIHDAQFNNASRNASKLRFRHGSAESMIDTYNQA